MPHGELRVGEVLVTALCDAVAAFPRRRDQTFRAVPLEAWEPFDERYPGTVADGHWRLHLHCFLIRAPGRTVLVDTGAGPAGAPGASWLDVSGRLPAELAAAGVDPSEVDDVVLTHLHLDHVGWNLVDDGDGAVRATFPRARYLVQRADWEAFASGGDANDRQAFAAVVAPLERLGCLELVTGDRPLAPGLGLLHTPGHTPGSQSVAIAAGGVRVLLWGDVATHPAQVTEPTWSGTDQDSVEAGRTRAAVLDRAQAEGWIIGPAHFPDPFGTVVQAHGRRWWQGG